MREETYTLTFLCVHLGTRVQGGPDGTRAAGRVQPCRRRERRAELARPRSSARARPDHEGRSRLLQRSAAEPADTDLLEIALRSPQATIALTSALARHGLIDEIPARIDIALPRGSRKPALARPGRHHLFDRATFDVGRERIPIERTDHTIAIYSVDRSNADAFRLRRTMGFELSTEALKTWLRRRGSKPGQLMALATRLPGGSGPLREALGYLA